MLRRPLIVLAFGGTFFLGLCLSAPASLLSALLERFTQGKMLLAQTEGSLWQGSGVLLLHGQRGSHALGRHRWRWRADAALEIWRGDEARMTLRLSPFAQRLELDGLHLALPATVLELAAPQLVPYQLRGTLEARGERLALDHDGLHGAVTLDWRQAASGLTGIRPLGDYRIVLQGTGGALEVRLSTLSGKLRLAGNGRLAGAGGMQFTGTAQAAPEAADELHELLHHIGPQASPGVYTLALIPQ